MKDWRDDPQEVLKYKLSYLSLSIIILLIIWFTGDRWIYIKKFVNEFLLNPAEYIWLLIPLVLAGIFNVFVYFYVHFLESPEGRGLDALFRPTLSNYLIGAVVCLLGVIFWLYLIRFSFPLRGFGEWMLFSLTIGMIALNVWGLFRCLLWIKNYWFGL